MREKRSHDRYPISLDVALVHAGEPYPGQTRDVSLGGMFVYTKAPLRFGTEVDVRLSLPSVKYTGELAAIVRWQMNDGVGLAFRSLRARDVHALNQLFKTPAR